MTTMIKSKNTTYTTYRKRL